MRDKRKLLRQLEKELFELRVKRAFLNKEIKRQMDKWQD